MLATRLFDVGDIRTVEVPEPVPGPGDIVVKVESAGICGTDRHLFKGEFPSVAGTTLGHEFCGIVVDAGSSTLAPGTRVTCDPNTWCGSCFHCQKGRVNLCSNNLATGIGRDGGFAEFCAFPSHKAHVLPDDLDPLFGAFCEPLACTLHGMDIGQACTGERVLVIGGGVIGLLAVQLASLAGSDVMLMTRTESKQQLGCTLGARFVADSEEEVRRQWPEGADLVLECAGVSETVAMSPRLARAGGRVVILGVLPDGAKVSIEPFDMLFREIQMHFSFLNPFTHARAARMIAEGVIDVSPLISRRVSLQEAPDVIANAAAAGEVRAIVVPAT
ncbi:alcohol dehydrogenase catalytic domain-containing protein [Granulosicoccus sp. 3-233]|uniref:alcohol dehydrogenase catalytic domain-containing protein n=1 Tax=Granulosicoccus sp. 3-233 TaxID=3417969 RepID=UPI003D33B695